jgi:hypothetical protein
MKMFEAQVTTAQAVDFMSKPNAASSANLAASISMDENRKFDKTQQLNANGLFVSN